MTNKFAYPPCAINWQTELPYTRHKWEIVQGVRLISHGDDEEVYYYHIRCSRCGFNDPKKVTY